MTLKKKIEKLKEIIEKDGAKLVLYPSKEYIIANGGSCSGYYDEDTLSLHVACKKPIKEWLGILVHEYAHFLQHKNNSKAWKAWKQNENLDFYIDDWLQDKKFNPSPKQLDRIYKMTILLEHEAEQTALSLIERLQLPLDREKYTKSANCYLMFYYWSRAHRLWYKTAPYRIPELLKKMPSKLLSPKQLEKEFHRFDFSKCFTRKEKRR